MSTNLRFSDSVRFRIEYEDSHPFGTLPSRRAELLIQQQLQPLVDQIHSLGIQRVISRSETILSELLSPEHLGAYFVGRGVLREESVFPDPLHARPAALGVVRPGSAPTSLHLAGLDRTELAHWMGEWQRGSGEPSTGPARALWRKLRDLGCMEECTAASVRPASKGGATLVGHATVRLSTSNTELVVDPFLLPREPGFPTGYQPITHSELAPDVVLITHSHPDHFDLGTLLRFGPSTTIVVPEVSRESILSIDMAYRLRELGFERVRVLRWFEETTVGDFRIIALPFYGEQPTSDGIASSQPRNIGNTYLVESPEARYAFVADAGRDPLGDIRTVATQAFEKYGAVDVLFGGYRSWSLYPVQYPMTSVPFNLLFVPRSLWTTRQTIMNDGDALIDTAERWHARNLVPYADGGAPWYWQLGLGPRLDTPSDTVNPHFDPRPEAVVRAALERSSAGADLIESPTRCSLMRPGDSLAIGEDGRAVVTHNEGHRWPYSEGRASTSWLEPEAITRKRIMLRLLATEELRRRGAEITPAQLQAFSDGLRREHNLVERQSMLDWLDRAELSMSEYCQILLEWCSVQHLEQLLGTEIDQRIAGQRAFASMRTMGES